MATRHFRAHQRFAVRLPVTVASTQRSVSARGFAIDLGIGGGACELDTPLRLGEHVEVCLDASEPLLLKGEVAWVGWGESSAVRLGLRFTDSSADLLDSLLDALGMAEKVS